MHILIYRSYLMRCYGISSQNSHLKAIGKDSLHIKLMIRSWSRILLMTFENFVIK